MVRPKGGAFRRAAFQKRRPMPISMKNQRNFDEGLGFCLPALSANLYIKPHNRSQTLNLVSGSPETSEDE
jgi:hypothetical protein